MHDREFLHNLRCHLSGGKPVTLEHDCLARLIGLAERGVKQAFYTGSGAEINFTPTTDIRIPIGYLVDAPEDLNR